MKTTLLTFISVLTLSVSAFAYQANESSDLMVLSGLVGHIDGIEDCAVDTEDFKITVRGSMLTAKVVCYAGKGSKYDDDRSFAVMGFVTGKGKKAAFVPFEIQQNP